MSGELSGSFGGSDSNVSGTNSFGIGEVPVPPVLKVPDLRVLRHCRRR